jgi:hypothetical protein
MKRTPLTLVFIICSVLFYAQLAYAADANVNIYQDVLGNTVPVLPSTYEKEISVSNFKIDRTGHNDVNISFDTEPSALCKISWGKNTPNGRTLVEQSFSQNHLFGLDGLEINNTYYFKVSCQKEGKDFIDLLIDKFNTFIPYNDVVPGEISGLSVVAGDYSIFFSWQNPKDLDLAGIRIIRSYDDKYPQNPYDGIVVFDGLVTSFTDDGLLSDTRYYYAVFAYDGSDNFSNGVFVSIKTKSVYKPEEISLPIIVENPPKEPAIPGEGLSKPEEGVVAPPHVKEIIKMPVAAELAIGISWAEQNIFIIIVSFFVLAVLIIIYVLLIVCIRKKNKRKNKKENGR